jgi:hypothetical protein
MNHISPRESRNIAGPRDKFQDDLNAAFRRSFDALKADIENICYAANVDMKPDLEAFEIFKDGCDSAFQIDFRMNRDG